MTVRRRMGREEAEGMARIWRMRRLSCMADMRGLMMAMSKVSPAWSQERAVAGSSVARGRARQVEAQV